MSGRAALVDIAQLKESLGAMEAEEAELVARLDTLRSSMQAHRHQIAHAHNSRALIHAFPAEMLAAIFLAGATTWDYYGLSISHVCQCWRNIALSLPALWARIHISCGHERLDMTSLLIERSQGHPLDILVHLDTWLVETDNIRGDPYGILRNRFNQISNTIPRWRKLAIYEATPQIFHDVLAMYLKDQKAPLLEILDVQCDLDDFSGILEFFSRGAPKLRHVTFSGLSCYVPKCPPVTTLCLQDLGGTYIYKQIKDISSHLTHLHIYGNTNQLPQFVGPSCVVPRLHFLEIAPCDSDGIIRLLRYINAPALKAFTVKFEGDIETGPSALESMLLASAQPPYPILQSLSLYDVNQAIIPNTFAKTITTKIPSVKYATLAVSQSFMLKHLLDPLNSREDGVPWPQLETISLYIDQSDIDILCDIIIDRIKRNIPLSSITFLWEVPENCEKQLEWLASKVAVRTNRTKSVGFGVSYVLRCDEEPHGAPIWDHMNDIALFGQWSPSGLRTCAFIDSEPSGWQS